MATLESPTRVDLSDDEDDGSSDYFADAETSSCGSFDDEIGWCEISENKGRFVCPVKAPLSHFPPLYLCSPRPQIWPTSHSNPSLSKGSLLPSSIGELQFPCSPFTTFMFVAIYSGGDPDHQIREEAVIQTRPEMRWGAGTVSKKNVRPFGPHFGLNIRGQAPRAPPMDPPGKSNYVWGKECLLK